MRTLSWLMLAGLLACQPAPSPQGGEPDPALFQEPPIAARPRAYWDWLNGNVSLPQLTREMESARAMGMGGFDIWDVGTYFNPDGLIPDGPPFMGEQSVQAIAYAVREAERLGMELGLTISSSWNAGGTWVQPEHGAMGLFRRDTVVQGPATFAGRLPFPELPAFYRGNRPMIHHRDSLTGLPTFYREVATLAYPLTADSLIADTAHIHRLVLGEKGAVRWEVPPGRWRLVRYVCAPTGQPLMIPSPQSRGLMLDHFSAEAQRANLDYIIGRLEEALGPLDQRALKYLYTDSYEVNSAVWTPTLPGDFRARAGYDLTPFLPVLDGFEVGGAEISARFTFDFTKLLSDLIVENHYALGREISAAHGLGFHAEAGGPGAPVHNVPFEDLRALGALTVPRGEFWREHPQLERLQIVKGIASAAHLYDQTYVEAEAFTSVWLWQEGPADLKPLADRAMMEGLNRFIYHTFPHVPPEAGTPGWVYNFGTLINTTRSWWPQSRDFHYYLGRSCYLLQMGNFVGDVAYYYGDQAPNFVPPKHEDPRLGPGFDYDVVNSEAILTKMTVRDGRICLPHGQCYELLVLPPGDRANPAVLAKVAELVEAGAWVYGPPPAQSYRLQEAARRDAEVRDLAATLWGPCDSVNVTRHDLGRGRVYWGPSLREVLAEKGVTPDLGGSSVAAGDLAFIHRRTAGADIYFLWNRGEEALQEGVDFRVAGRVPAWWDPETGQVTPLPHWETTATGTRVFLTLPPGGSGFVVFQPGRGGAPLRSLRQDGQPVLAGDGTGLHLTPEGLLSWVAGEFSGEAGAAFATRIDLPAPLPLTGAWEVFFPHGWGAPAQATFAELHSWHVDADPGIQHFSGTGRYERSFTLPPGYRDGADRLFLDLGEVAEVAELWLNGHHLGVRWHAPFRYDITPYLKPGENYLIVEVTNTLNNQLVGDGSRPEAERRTRSNISRLPNAWMNPLPEAPLLPSGLLGPVRIVPAGVVWSPAQ